MELEDGYHPADAARQVDMVKFWVISHKIQICAIILAGDLVSIVVDIHDHQFAFPASHK